MESPNFRFNSIIQEMNCCFGINDIFDIYYLNISKKKFILI